MAEITEGNVRWFAVCIRRNMERPDDAAQILRETADAIEQRMRAERTSEDPTPFVVRFVEVDLYEGIVTVYIEP